MNNRCKKILVALLTILLISFGSWYIYEYNIGRYRISAPMEDIEYKKSVIRDSHNIFYKLENLRSLCGESELTEFIRQNNNNSAVYSPKIENRKKGLYRANFHIHTTNSDGVKTVEERLNEAQTYAQKINNTVYIAITDHNTVLGAKDIIRVLQKNPNKYKNLRIVPGIEISALYFSEYSPEPVAIHVLAWCINPYDKVLNKMFYKKDLKDKWNMRVANFDFDYIIGEMSDYAIVGIAHPARYIGHLNEKIYPYIPEFFDRYLKQTSKIPFIEGYYQSYTDKEKSYIYGGFDKFSDYINEQADKRNIMKTGSTDAHGVTIFRRY